MTRITATRIIAALVAGLALAGCFPLAATYVHLDSPGIRHVQAICRDIGPPVLAAWESSGVRFEATLKPLYAAKTGEGFVRVQGRKDSIVRPAELQGRIVRKDGNTPTELRFGFARRFGLSTSRHPACSPCFHRRSPAPR